MKLSVKGEITVRPSILLGMAMADGQRQGRIERVCPEPFAQKGSAAMALTAMADHSGAGVARLLKIFAACGGAPAFRAAPGSSSLCVCLPVCLAPRHRLSLRSFSRSAINAPLPREVAAEAGRFDDDWSMR